MSDLSLIDASPMEEGADQRQARQGRSVGLDRKEEEGGLASHHFCPPYRQHKPCRWLSGSLLPQVPYQSF